MIARHLFFIDDLALPAQANQQILKRLTGRPGYKKRGTPVTAVLTNQICRITDGDSLKFPGTKVYWNGQ